MGCGGSSVHEFRLRKAATQSQDCVTLCTFSRLRGLLAQSQDWYANLGFLDYVMQSRYYVLVLSLVFCLPLEWKHGPDSLREVGLSWYLAS